MSEKFGQRLGLEESVFVLSNKGQQRPNSAYFDVTMQQFCYKGVKREETTKTIRGAGITIMHVSFTLQLPFH